MKKSLSIRKLLLPGTVVLLSLGMLAFRSQPEESTSIRPVERVGIPVSIEQVSTAPLQRLPLTVEANAAHLVDAIIQMESGGDPRKVGRQGERGLMQIRFGTWRDMTTRLFGTPLPFEQAFDPALNRRVGTAYLAWLQKDILSRRSEWRTDERSLLLGAYNAGPGRLKTSGYSLTGMPRQTRDYVARASALHDQAAGDQTRILAAPDHASTDS
jgi:soluble lytic murein transglycosylase-like protein